VLRYRGRRKAADRILDELEGRGLPIEGRFFRAQHAAGDRNPERLRELARQVAPDVSVGWLVLALAVADDPEEAERLLREYPVEPVILYGVHNRTVAQDVTAALRTRKAGDVVRAREILQSARRRALFKDIRVLDYFIGETCSLAGDDQCAVEALADGRRFIWSFLPGVVAYPRSLYLLAQSQARLGRHNEARTTARKLLTLWEDADSDLPLLAEAKALCRNLRCRAP